MSETQEDINQIKEDVTNFVHSEIYGGFTEFSEIQENAIDWLADELSDRRKFEAIAAEAVSQVTEAYRKESASWPAKTDCDRLDAAFKDLESRSILARQNYWCCQLPHANPAGIAWA